MSIEILKLLTFKERNPHWDKNNAIHSSFNLLRKMTYSKIFAKKIKWEKIIKFQNQTKDNFEELNKIFLKNLFYYLENDNVILMWWWKCLDRIFLFTFHLITKLQFGSFKIYFCYNLYFLYLTFSLYITAMLFWSDA